LIGCCSAGNFGRKKTEGHARFSWLKMLAKIRLDFSSEDKIDKRKKQSFIVVALFVPLPLRIKTMLLLVVIEPTVRREYVDAIC
jgi:hypothetical protein